MESDTLQWAVTGAVIAWAVWHQCGEDLYELVSTMAVLAIWVVPIGAVVWWFW